MTILGAALVSSTRAVAWTDSETYGADRTPVGHVSKLSANPLACAMLIGTGYVSLLRRAAQELATASTFDDAASRLPATLRAAEQEFLRDGVRVPEGPPQIVAMIGHSHSRGRLSISVFEDRHGFEPYSARSLLLPNVAGEDFAEAQGIISAAQDQMCELRRSFPLAGGGVLVAAFIETPEIRVAPLFDLGRGMMLRRPVALEPLLC